KIEAGKLTLDETPFHLGELLREVERLFRTEARKKGLELEMIDRTVESGDFPMDGVLLGDSLRFRQILLNLVSNAVKFTHEGSVSVETSVSRATDVHVVIGVRVTDTGIGIAPEN